MIIVSQDKDSIINFDKTQNIWIDDNVLDKTNATFEIYADGEILGEYATETRANEILSEIAKCYANTEQYKCVCNMPECLIEKIEYLNELAENAFIYIMQKE